MKNDDEKPKETSRGLEYKKDGYTYISTDQDMEELRDKYKIPFCCPACRKLMYQIDDTYFYKYSVCHECAINYLLDRSLSEDILKNREECLKLVENQISLKKR